jgi:hypothetical protein
LCASKHKYQKRKKQKRKQVKNVLCLLGVSLMVLAFTGWTLVGGYSSSSEKMEQMKRAKAIFKEGMKNGKSRVLRGANEFIEKTNKIGPVMEEREENLRALEEAILANADSGTQWMNPEFLPSISKHRPLLEPIKDVIRGRSGGIVGPRKFFHVNRGQSEFAWEDSASSSSSKDGNRGPKVDFTKHSYEYPEILSEPPDTLGDYPKLKPMKALMENWPQDDIDHPPTPFEEVLIHFDYTKKEDVEAARKFRDAKLPFKFINVPEVIAAGEKWTDEYVNRQFSANPIGREYKQANGNCQESIDNFFAFFNSAAWDVQEYGLAPTRNNDWKYV